MKHKRFAAAFVSIALLALLPAPDAGAKGAKTAPKTLSKAQTESLKDAKGKAGLLCLLQPKTAQPKFCDQKDKNIAALETAIKADENAGLRIVIMLGDAVTLIECYSKAPGARDACNRLMNDGAPQQLSESSQSVVVGHLGKDKPTDNDKAVGAIAHSILDWVRPFISDDGDNGAGGGSKVD